MNKYLFIAEMKLISKIINLFLFYDFLKLITLLRWLKRCMDTLGKKYSRPP